MKTRKYLTLLTAVLMLFTLALAGCGGEGGATALTEEEYQAAFEKLGEDFSAIQTDITAITSEDVDSALSLLEQSKQSLREFINIIPPEAYAAAHEKLAAGCQGMVDYLEATTQLVGETDETKIGESVDSMLDVFTNATDEIMEGAELLEAAVNE